MQDLAAVRADLLRRGLAAPDATALWGVSWGAYLVLLALGTRPELWRAGIAVKPLADWAAAHRSSTSALRAFDIRLFGGTPDEVPERYARSSPLSYASRVTAPLLVVGATRDVKCPPDQIRSYLAALDDAGVPYEAMWLDTGHDGYDGAAHVAVLRRAMTFLNRRLAVPRGPVTEDSPVAGEPGAAAHTTARAGTNRSLTKGEIHAEGHHPQRSARGRGGEPQARHRHHHHHSVPERRRGRRGVTSARPVPHGAGRAPLPHLPSPSSAPPPPLPAALRRRDLTSIDLPLPPRRPKEHARARSAGQHALVPDRPALAGPRHPQAQRRRTGAGRHL
ncbi:hypothetical protein GCM10020256_02220 [Streptomyces thermocoprophilus]